MEKLKFDLFNTGLGWMGIVASPHGLREIILPQESEDAVLRMVKERGHAVGICDSGTFDDLPWRLIRYFGGEVVHFPDKLDFTEASKFQRSVWKIARSISYGETRSYAWVAANLGLPNAARAVGQALGRNPLPIVIPCHRVINSNGGLGGFSAGLGMKGYLLRLEKAGTR